MILLAMEHGKRISLRRMTLALLAHVVQMWWKEQLLENASHLHISALKQSEELDGLIVLPVTYLLLITEPTWVELRYLITITAVGDYSLWRWKTTGPRQG